MIRVLLADDQSLVRAGFRMLLDSEEDIEVVGEAEDGEQAFALAQRLKPDVVLMDIRMPKLDGLAATQRLVSAGGLDETHVLILTTFESDEYVFEALRCGASGFVVKDIEPEELLQAVRVVARGDALLSPSVTRRLIAEFVSRPERKSVTPQALQELTVREREILTYVGRGLSNQQIADELVISPATAKTHVSRVMMKLGVHDRAQLVVYAYETGLVQPGEI